MQKLYFARYAERGSIPQHETLRCGGHRLEKVLLGQDSQQEGLRHLGDVAQQPGGESLCQTALNGSICLGVLIAL